MKKNTSFVNDMQFFAESSFDSVSAAMGVISQSSVKSSYSVNYCSFCQKENDSRHHECYGINNIVINNGKDKCSVVPVKNAWTRLQWLKLITSLLSNFGCGICISLQAPFFPAESTRKNVSASEYGFVFSAFSLTVFILAPIFGKYIAKIGPRFMMNTGIFIVSVCCILFGFLNRVASRKIFVALALLIRIVEGLGDAAYNTANFTTMAFTFPGDLGKVFALLRAAFGLGLIVGPAVGGILYELGGYTLPFLIMGSLLLVLSIVNTTIFWNEKDDDIVSLNQPTPSIFKVLSIPSICLNMSTVTVGAFTIGFLSTTLEPHLRQFTLNAIQVGFMFIISGGVYAVTSMFWGWLCDGKVPPKILVVIGSFILTLMCFLIGPAPFLPFANNLASVITSLFFHGFGNGALMLASHVDAIKQALLFGFPDSHSTFGVISGVWAAFFQLGNFAGPLLGGILYDTIGFANATMVVLGLILTLLFANLLYYFKYDYNAQEVTNNETTPLV